VTYDVVKCGREGHMVYGFHNRKGGVGKTSLSTNCAVLSDFKTCLIDADPQGNATSYLMPDPPEFDLSDVLNRRCNIEDALYSVLAAGATLGVGEKDWKVVLLRSLPLIYGMIVAGISFSGMLKVDRMTSILYKSTQPKPPSDEENQQPD